MTTSEEVQVPASATSEAPCPSAPLPCDLPAILDGLPIAIFVLAANGTPVYANAAAHELLGDRPDPSVKPEELAKRYHAMVAGTDEPYPVDRMPIVRALAGEATGVEDMEIERPDRRVPVEVWAAPVFEEDSTIAYAVAAFHDVSERKAAEADAARLYEETVRQSRWLASVRHIQFSVLSGAGLEGALSLVAREAQEVMSGDCTSIGVPESEGFLKICAAEGAEADGLRGQRVSTAESIMGEVMAMDAGAILDDASCHGTLADPVVRLDLGPAVFVPLSAEGKAFGSLCVARRRGRELFTEHELAAAEAFANQAALAVKIGQTQRELAHLAVVRDRERRAKDLHNRVMRSLATLGDRLDALREAEGADGGAGAGAGGRAESIGQAAEALDRVIAELAREGYTWRIEAVEQSTLEKALLALAAEFEARAGIVTVLDLHLEDDLVIRLSPRTDDVLELVGHALADVRRRDAARTCEIEVACSPEGATICVEDDGLTNGPPGSEERWEVLSDLAARIGASFEAENTPGRRTVLRFVLPGT